MGQRDFITRSPRLAIPEALVRMTFAVTTFIKNIDRWLTPFACRVGTLISKLNFRSPSKDTVILRPGGMGDLILLTLAIETLGYDSKDFFWVIETRSEPWAKHLGLSYRCWNEGLASLLIELAGRFKRVINTEQYFGLSQATALALKNRRGFLFSFQSNRASSFADRQIPYDQTGHEHQQFLALVTAALGTPSQPHPPTPPVPTDSHTVFALGGLQYLTRRLTPKAWRELILKYAPPTDPILVVCGPDDRAYALAIIELIPERLQLFQGSFEDVVQVIQKSKLVIGMEGGLIHVASYYKVPAYAVFTSSSHRKWHPLAKTSGVITRDDLNCQPCAVFAQVPPCPNQLACLQENKMKLIRISE